MAYQPKSYRKFLVGAVSTAVVASSFAGVAGAAANFTDVNSNYKEAVDFLVSKGINGISATEFGVQQNIKRVDAAVFVVKALGLDVNAAPASGFTDVPDRAVKEVNALKAAGITSGKSATEFGAQDLITRGELAIWLDKAFDLKGEGDVSAFTDATGIYTDSIKALVANKITSGTSATTFGTKDNAKRGDFAIFVKRAADATAELAVTGVSAINNADLKVTLAGNVKDVTIDKTDFEVKVNDSKVDFNFKNVSGNEVSLEVVTPLQNGDKVEVVGLSDLANSSASTTYTTTEYSKVEAVESTVFDGEAGQFLVVKVDGAEKTASQLAKEGYEVSFQADTAVFPSAATTSKTGEIDGNATALVAGTPFEYKVTISKENKVLESDYTEVAVYDKSKTAASAISTVEIGSTGVDKITSGKVVVGETGLAFEKVVADLQDGRKNVDLLAATGLVKFETSDATVATVASNGAITAKKAGTVTFTITSGTVKKDVTLTVVDKVRELNTAVYSGSEVKLVKGGSSTELKLVAKDQYGDTFNTTGITLGAIEAVTGGKSLTSGTATSVAAVSGSEDEGKFTVDITPSATEVGSGTVILTKDSKNLVSIPVSVTSATTSVTKQLVGDATTIDLNPEKTDDAIEFKLKEYLSGAYNQDLDLNTHKVQVFDADGEKIYDVTLSSSTPSITITRADLIAETAGDATIGQADAAVDTALAAGTTSIANFETGTGLIKVLDASGNLVASKNFSIVDTAVNISGATFATGVDFTTANATNLKLNELLTSVSTTASAYDGVLRYEDITTAGTNQLAIYFDKNATPNGYSYAAGDILVGTVLTTAIDTNNVSLTDDGSTYKVDTVTVNSATTTDDEKVQFNVYKRGDVSVAKSIIKVVK